jgi:hypothetical protein
MRQEVVEWVLDGIEEDFDSMLDWRIVVDRIEQPTKVFQWLTHLNETLFFHTVEGDKVSKASNAELKRWCLNKSVILNGVAVGPFDEMPEDLESIVLHPKGKRKCTLR